MDSVSALHRNFSSCVESSNLSPIVPARVFTTSVGNTLWTLATPAFVLLAKQFHASVDEVASSFGANLIGLGTFTYVSLTFPISYI